MKQIDRRTFLRTAGATTVASALPHTIAKAASIRAHTRHRSIKDVEHIVILMQENRSFDHYFGTLRGVRGFGDPRAIRLPSGKSVWHQADSAGEVLPYRPPVDDVGFAFFPDPPHGWNDGHAAWNGGMFDQWVPNKGRTAMAHMRRHDIPYHFALAEAFTLCDAYFCSLKGPTDPNRYHMWSGWVGNDGAAGGPVITNAEAGYDWSTYPERLERAGISWKVYQDIGVGLNADGFWGWTGDKPYIGNYGDNSLLYFHQYQNAAAGTALAERAKTGTNIAAGGGLFDVLRADVAQGRLPQVSWIVAPEAYSEHPNWPANWGAWYVSQVLDALTSNPDLWSRTVLFVNYDEDGGFFDHMMPPNPPETPTQGASTVSIENELYRGDSVHPAGHYGFGIRVPMLVVSPWSKGGFVNSEVFDHTSLIRFLEKRFGDEHAGLVETNITPWRRAVAGDLTSAFDFRRPDAALPPLPDTSAYAPADRAFHPNDELEPALPQALPRQEPGVRRARALPYALHADLVRTGSAASVTLELRNVGAATAVFHVRSAAPDIDPRSYTVEPDKHLSGEWLVARDGSYDLAVYGPNGFFRRFKGATGEHHGAHVEVRCEYRPGGLRLSLFNHALRKRHLRIASAYFRRVEHVELPYGLEVGRWLELEGNFGWYDFSLTLDGDDAFKVRLAGHVENGRDSISDPLLGGVRLAD